MNSVRDANDVGCGRTRRGAVVALALFLPGACHRPIISVSGRLKSTLRACAVGGHAGKTTPTASAVLDGCNSPVSFPPWTGAGTSFCLTKKF